MPGSLSRRHFLALTAALPAAAADNSPLLPAEWKRYADPATELEVTRLTDPSFASGLAGQGLRRFTRHSDWLLYWSERTGKAQGYLANLKTGESEQVTEAAELDREALTLSADESAIYYFDGAALKVTRFPKLTTREVYRLASGTTRTGFSINGEGAILFGEFDGRSTRIMRLQKDQAHRAFDADGRIEDISARPGNLKSRLRLFYRTGNRLWVSTAEGGDRRVLQTEPGQILSPCWTANGAAITYLHVPDNPRELVTLREHNPDTGADTLVARTSQFISAAPNGDSSVFVGASRSVASPYVLILVRSVRRELTLAEHHASNPAIVSPSFSPDSRSIAFNSDRHGKPAVYLMAVGKFVEETNGEDAPATAGKRPPRG